MGANEKVAATFHPETEYTPATTGEIDYTPIVGPVDGKKRQKRIEALAAHDAEVAAKALEDAADAIPRDARRDECDMHGVARVDSLPHLSLAMLNGVTRASERLRARAAALRVSTGGENHG